MFTIRWRPIHSKTKKTSFRFWNAQRKQQKSGHLLLDGGPARITISSTWHTKVFPISSSLSRTTQHRRKSTRSPFFCWLSVQTFHFMGWKKNEEQVSKFWPRRHHGSPFCYGIVCPHFSKEKPPRKLQIVAYYVGRRTRLWENAVNNSHFEKIISNTDVTRQMLQFQLFIPRKIFCWQHNIQWPTEKVDYSTISITKTWYVIVI